MGNFDTHTAVMSQIAVEAEHSDRNEATTKAPVNRSYPV